MDDLGLFYSGDALYVKDKFLGDNTDLNFYFEDEHKEYFYEKLLKRLLCKSKIGIFCLSGKPSLYKKYSEVSNGSMNKKSIFIADGDFDKLLVLEMIDAENFIYLEKI